MHHRFARRAMANLNLQWYIQDLLIYKIELERSHYYMYNTKCLNY